MWYYCVVDDAVDYMHMKNAEEASWRLLKRSKKRYWHSTFVITTQPFQNQDQIKYLPNMFFVEVRRINPSTREMTWIDSFKIVFLLSSYHRVRTDSQLIIQIILIISMVLTQLATCIWRHYYEFMTKLLTWTYQNRIAPA